MRYYCFWTFPTFLYNIIHIIIPKLNVPWHFGNIFELLLLVPVVRQQAAHSKKPQPPAVMQEMELQYLSMNLQQKRAAESLSLVYQFVQVCFRQDWLPGRLAEDQWPNEQLDHVHLHSFWRPVVCRLLLLSAACIYQVGAGILIFYQPLPS